MKTYTVELNDDLSCIYEDIARMHQKRTEECLAIILERVIRTMLRQPWSHEDRQIASTPAEWQTGSLQMHLQPTRTIAFQ